MNTGIIQNGRIVTQEGIRACDIRMENGVIAEIAKGLSTAGLPVYDAANCLVFPGFVDAHTHLDMESAAGMTADDFDSGTRAALCGGTTTIIDFATQARGGTLQRALDVWHAKAAAKAWCDYGFHMAITDWGPAVEAEMAAMFRQGVTSFKVYMAYESLRLDDGAIFAILRAVREGSGIVSCHCENGDLVDALVAQCRARGALGIDSHPLSRPTYLEGEAVRRFLTIARAAQAPAYVVHLSAADGLAEARRAREAGQTVALETCPQYLTLTDALYAQPAPEAAKYVCSPPLRAQADQDALWRAIDAIDVIATDHCSFNSRGQKQMGYSDFSLVPNGLPGIEHRAQLLYTAGVKAGRISAPRMAALLSEAPARIFGLYPKKGAIAVGSDADLVLWEDAQDTLRAARMQQRVDYTPYEGMRSAGKARAVFLRGRLAAERGTPLGTPRGQYVPRGAADLSRVAGQQA